MKSKYKYFVVENDNASVSRNKNCTKGGYFFSFLQVLQDRIEALNKQIQNLESKSQSLQLTIDRLTSNLQKTEEEESNQKERVQSLNLTLSDNQAIINELQERITQLQKGLTSSEHDRRVLQERLDSTRWVITVCLSVSAFRSTDLSLIYIS